MKKIWKIESLSELYECIGSKEEELSKAFDQKDKYYHQLIQIPKKNGFRVICAIDKSCILYKLQQNLKRYFLENIMVSDLAYGFKRNHDYFQFLEMHKNFYGKSNYLRVDITNFFGTIGKDILLETLDYYIHTDSDEEYGQIMDTLLQLLLYHGELIQGTPVAPVVSNIVFRPLDIRIERYCEKQHITYSRYADDLLFSSEGNKVLSKNFIRTIERILKSKGFDINYNKLRREKNMIALNGFVVDDNLRLSRKKLKPISRILFYMEKNKYKKDQSWIIAYNEEMNKYKKEKDVTVKNSNDLTNVLAGYRAFIINAIRHSDNDSFIMRSEQIIKRIEDQIAIIEKLGQ